MKISAAGHGFRRRPIFASGFRFAAVLDQRTSQSLQNLFWRSVWGSNPSRHLERVMTSPEVERNTTYFQKTSAVPARGKLCETSSHTSSASAAHASHDAHTCLPAHTRAMHQQVLHRHTRSLSTKSIFKEQKSPEPCGVRALHESRWTLADDAYLHDLHLRTNFQNTLLIPMLPISL
jgi:hypothetical protein